MAKLKIIIRKVSSPYSDKSGFAAEFLEKSGKRFFVAEQFGKELTGQEEQLAKPCDIIHLIGYAWKFGKDNKFALAKLLKDFGQVCYEETVKIDNVRKELAARRKARNLAAAAVADIALPISQRKLELAGKSDETIKNEYAAAVARYDNALKWATPRIDDFRKACARMSGVLECTDEERAALCGHYGR